jgi:hypothetical protein
VLDGALIRRARVQPSVPVAIRVFANYRASAESARPVSVNYNGAIDWSAVAAWVQAVGSVLAILVAIWINRQTARSAERERTCIREQMWDDRILAIKYCASGLRNVARTLDCATINKGAVGLGYGALRALEVTQKAIDFYIENAAEVGPDMMGVLAHAQAVLADGRRALAPNRYASNASLKAVAEGVRARAKDIAEVLVHLEGLTRFRSRADS